MHDQRSATHIDETVQACAMRQAMARLSAEHRAVLTQVYYRGRSIVDTAAVLNVPVGTVKTRTYSALLSLRLVLEELGIGLDQS
jgi:RNA polymerase sigma-70 factor, ECF subfamily